MSDFFPASMPNKDLSPEEKTRLARRFRRKANLTDGCAVLGFALFCLAALLESRGLPFSGLIAAVGVLLMAAFGLGCVMTYSRCPVCGNRIIHGEYGKYLAPFIWRFYECPVCYFSPDWSK